MLMIIDETALMHGNDAGLLTFKRNQARSPYLVAGGDGPERSSTYRIEPKGTEIRFRLITIDRHVRQLMQGSYLTYVRGISVTISHTAGRR